jgi:hypothetical protein
MSFVPVDEIEEAFKGALVPGVDETEMPEAMISSGELLQARASLN